MKTKFTLVALVSLACLILNWRCPAFSLVGTAFTYQGRLNDSIGPVTGTYDLSFAVYDSSNTPGNFIAGPVTNTAVGVTNGLFMVTVDFGTNVFNLADRWLEIGVRTNGGTSFATLAPRQHVTPAPYAMTALNAGVLLGNLPASQVIGTISPAQLPVTVLTNGQSGVSLAGTFSGNGAGVTNVSFLNLNFGGPNTIAVVLSPGVGNSPYSVAAADVNNDGKLDLISANYSDNTLSVLTNTGNGNFVLASSPAVGSSPRSVIAADVNGDARMDLICANYNGGTLTVLTNTGNGNFVLASSPAVGSGPYSVTAADVNGDGKMDLICANLLSSTLSVLTNNGSGGFALASSPGVGSEPDSVTTADVNGDGKVDLISANYSGTLSVLTNNGSGGFVLASSPSVGGSDVYSVAAADVNGDGKVDLISANHGSDTLSELTNNGAGSFVLASKLAVGGGPSSVTAADVNGDGKMDLICADDLAGTLSVLTNNGSGGFVLAASPVVGSAPQSVVAADLNGDGKVDFVSANLTANTLSVLFNLPVLQGDFTGDGYGIANLNAANLTGTIDDSRLSFNVARLSSNQSFIGHNTFFATGTFNTNQTFNGGILLNSPAGFDQTSIGGFLVDAPFIPGGRFCVLANGDVGIGNNAPGQLLVVGSGGAYCNGTTWVNGSDRNAKEDFTAVNPRDVLEKVSALPITRWNYKADETQQHIGPMAQDFYAAFNVGPDEKHITTVDEGGVALAAIQGLNEKLQADNAQLRQENNLLAKRLDALEAEVKAMARKNR